MRIERTRNTKRSVLWGMINKIVTLLLPFFIRTVIIKMLGAEYLGLNSLFGSILQVLNLSELGFSSAIVYCMYKPIAENDVSTINALMKFYRKVYRIIGIIIGVVGIILIPFIPCFVGGEIPEDINLYIIYIVYLLNTVVSYILFAYKSAIPSAFQRNDIISIAGTLTQGGMYIAQIITLFLCKNYYYYIIIMPIFTVANNLVLSFWVDKVYPEYKCEGELLNDTKKEIKEKISGLMINKICQTTRNALDSICISAFLGLKITAIYNNYFYIINALISISIVITSSMTSGVGNSIVIESKEKNYKDMCKINFIYMWIAGWATICLLCLYQPFMKIWVGDSLMFDMPVVVLFVLYFYFLKMGDVRGLYSDAAGLWWENRYRAIGESITNIVLNIVLVQFWGVYGVIIATMLSLLIINFGLGSQIVFNHYFQNGKLKEYYFSHGKYFSITFVIAIIVFEICSFIKINFVMNLLIRGIICLCLPNILYFFIYKRTKEYKQSVPWVLHKLKF